MLIRRCFDHKDDDRYLDALGNQNSNETIKYSTRTCTLTCVSMCVSMVSNHTQCVVKIKWGNIYCLILRHFKRCVDLHFVYMVDGNIIIIVSNHLQDDGVWFVALKQTAFILLLVRLQNNHRLRKTQRSEVYCD